MIFLHRKEHVCYSACVCMKYSTSAARSMEIASSRADSIALGKRHDHARRRRRVLRVGINALMARMAPAPRNSGGLASKAAEKLLAAMSTMAGMLPTMIEE